MRSTIDPKRPLDRKIAGLLAAIGLAASPFPAKAAPPGGLYGGLILSMSDGHVSGAFSEHRVGNGADSAPQFSCEFLLHGRLFGDTATIVTQTAGGNEVISGRLVFEDAGVEMRLNDEPDGCAMTSGDMTHSAYAAKRVVAGRNWIGAALIRSRRAALRASPGLATVRPYLVRGDAVAIVARRGHWIEVEYPGGARPARGWLTTTEIEEAYTPHPG